MSYTVNENGTVTLDTGETVAVSIARERLANGSGVAVTATASLLDENGQTKVDDAGPVSSTFTHNDSVGGDDVAKDVLLAVLGEPTQTPWATDLLAQVSIRNHIAAANVSPLNITSLLA